MYQYWHNSNLIVFFYLALARRSHLFYCILLGVSDIIWLRVIVIVLVVRIALLVLKVHIESINEGFNFLRLFIIALLKACMHVQLVNALVFEVIQDLVVDLRSGLNGILVVVVFV